MTPPPPGQLRPAGRGRGGGRGRRRRSPAALLFLAAALGVVALQARMPFESPGWWGPPSLLLAALLHVAWRARGEFVALAGLASVALLATGSLQPPLLTALELAALLATARSAGRVLDVSYWFIQPFVALLALAVAEAFLALQQMLYFGAVAWTPPSVLLATALVTPLLHPPAALIARWWTERLD